MHVIWSNICEKNIEDTVGEKVAKIIHLHVLYLLHQCLSDEEGGEEDDAPKSDWKPPPVIPKEENRTGTNKRTFFATTERKCKLTI